MAINICVSKGLNFLASKIPSLSIKSTLNFASNNSTKIAFGIEGAAEMAIGTTLKSCAIGSCIAGIASFAAGTVVDYMHNDKDLKTAIK